MPSLQFEIKLSKVSLIIGFRKGGSRNKKLIGLTNIQELSYYKQLFIQNKEQ